MAAEAPATLDSCHPLVQFTGQRLRLGLIVAVAAALVLLLRNLVPAAVVWRLGKPMRSWDVGVSHGPSGTWWSRWAGDT